MRTRWVVALAFVVLSSARAEQKPIVIGASMSLSGSYAAGGKYSLEGTQLWVDDVNGCYIRTSPFSPVALFHADPKRVHAHRIVGGHCHYRHSGGDAVAGVVQGQTKGVLGLLHEQSQTAKPGNEDVLA